MVNVLRSWGPFGPHFRRRRVMHGGLRCKIRLLWSALIGHRVPTTWPANTRTERSPSCAMVAICILLGSSSNKINKPSAFTNGNHKKFVVITATITKLRRMSFWKAYLQAVNKPKNLPSRNTTIKTYVLITLTVTKLLWRPLWKTF